MADNFSNYLKVDVAVGQNETPDLDNPVLIRFTVTNIAKTQEDQPDIIFDEVQLKVGVPPDLHIEKAKNLVGGQSFSYEHHCTYDAIMKLQWRIEGTISPSTLLQFRCRPNTIIRNQQLPVKAYFDFLSQINIHQWLEGTLKTFVGPGPDTTLSEMKAKEDSLNSVVGDLRKSGQQLQEFLGLVNHKNISEDIINHRNLVQDYLKKTDQEICELIQILRTHRTDGFDNARDNVVARLTTRENELDKATTELAKKLGIITPDASIEVVTKVQPPPTIALKEIDLHKNHTLEEALPILGEFLRESYRDNVRVVRIIHGKGIGVLRKGIREYLEAHKLVKSVGTADKDHGGEGATEATLIDYSASN